MTWMTEHITPRSRTTLVLVGGALAAWAVTIVRMRGMDEGPGTDLGGLGWYLGVWVTMTAAMMLPTAAPAARHVARRASHAPTLLFAAGYLAVWTIYGLLAYGVYRVVGSLDIGQLAWDRSGPYVAGGVIVAAGLYELTPLKRMSLRRCRSHSVRERLPERSRTRPRLRRLLRGADGRALRARRDEPLLDGRRDRRHLRREGAAARSAARTRRRGGARRARHLGRRLAGDRARADRTRPARPPCRWRWAGEHLPRG